MPRREPVFPRLILRAVRGGILFFDDSGDGREVTRVIESAWVGMD